MEASTDWKKEKQVWFHIEEGRNLEAFVEKNEFVMPLKQGITDQLPLYRNSNPSQKFDIRNRTKIPSFVGSKIFPDGQEPPRNTVFDPGSEAYLRWNRVFLFFCLVALFVDPLFFYLPSLSTQVNNTSCMESDVKMRIVLTFFRTVADLFYVIHVIVKFRTAYVAPSSRVFGKGELVTDRNKIALRYLRSDFFIDVIAALPLPQMVVWWIQPGIRSSRAELTNNALVLVILFQYIPRLYLIFPLSSQIIKTTGVVTRTAWAGAAYNLLLYMLASHVLGASWYLMAIERNATCWISACNDEHDATNCALRFLDCDSLGDPNQRTWANSTLVFTNCNPQNTTFFNYGIFGNAFGNNVVSSPFVEKYFYCLWWGLQNLSCLGQNLQTSTYVGETLFAILIAVFGLVLFAHLIGNMQTYLQSITVRFEEWRLKQRDTEEWMKHRQLPEELRQRVRRFTHYKWLTTRGVDEESILLGLPTDLRRDIQRHLCLDLVRRVPFFSQMDDQLLDAICERLVPALFTEAAYIVREGDPVSEMLFVIRGRLESSTTNGGRSGFFNSTTLKPGDFCGEELLSWALLPKSDVNLPSSTRTVRSVTEVEAFVLGAEELRFVANQFRRLHSKKLQHTFRYYSHQWRTWAACFIQAAWRRHQRLRLLSAGAAMMPETSTATFLQEAGAASSTQKMDGQDDDDDDDVSKLRKPDEPDFSVTDLH
ncbi:hypothetical protein M569_11705 [Genlisea aurea]|uniref:Cyclic nucleotide-binding domain-containing protein n=1 Tax=Genlisea aurea TaxID=192259 RepID=S8CEY8_9LAMI|nr:hypothetical protein M569_11705 [Genlisea aurea]